MTWIKLEDKTPRHPKISGLSDKAFRVWISALCYASEFLTDGLLHPTFWRSVPKQVRAELTGARLWDWEDPNFLIHDYLEHQTAKADVEADRKAARERRSKRGQSSPEVRENVARTSPERRPPDTDTEVPKTQKESVKNGHAPLIMSPLQFEKRRQSCAFVGSRLEVPHGLHGDLRKRLGGDKAEFELMAWYEDLNTEIEESGEAIVPDVFKWLNARFATWAAKSGEQTTEQILAAIAKLPKGIGR